jgi:hypothetical protein
MMINLTSQRVRLNTADHVNEEIRRETERRIAFYVAHPEQIDGRLAELDQEWDIERLIETEAPTMTLTGIALGALLGRKWLVLPLFAQSMVLLHALQGFYPLLPLFRRMGVRTNREIATERYALKAIRGDFRQVPETAGDGRERADQAVQAGQATPAAEVPT